MRYFLFCWSTTRKSKVALTFEFICWRWGVCKISVIYGSSRLVIYWVDCISDVLNTNRKTKLCTIRSQNKVLRRLVARRDCALSADSIESRDDYSASLTAPLSEVRDGSQKINFNIFSIYCAEVVELTSDWWNYLMARLDSTVVMRDAAYSQLMILDYVSALRLEWGVLQVIFSITKVVYCLAAVKQGAL